jgi:hypothetical protein
VRLNEPESAWSMSITAHYCLVERMVALRSYGLNLEAWRRLSQGSTRGQGRSPFSIQRAPSTIGVIREGGRPTIVQMSPVRPGAHADEQ